MDVNPTKEKKLTNIRTHSHDDALRLVHAAAADPRVGHRVHRRRRARRGDADGHPAAQAARCRCTTVAASAAREDVRRAVRARGRETPTRPADPASAACATIAAVTVYLDHAAASPLRPEVLDGDAAAPPATAPTRPPRTARAGAPGMALDEAHERLARSIGAAAAQHRLHERRDRGHQPRRQGRGLGRQGGRSTHRHDRGRAQGRPRVVPAAGALRLRDDHPAGRPLRSRRTRTSSRTRSTTGCSS